MQVTETTHCIFRVEMSDDELLHLMTIVVSTDKLPVSNVESLICYLLQYCEQHWYDTIKEPLTDGTAPGPTLA